MYTSKGDITYVHVQVHYSMYVLYVRTHVCTYGIDWCYALHVNNTHYHSVGRIMKTMYLYSMHPLIQDIGIYIHTKSMHVHTVKLKYVRMYAQWS